MKLYGEDRHISNLLEGPQAPRGADPDDRFWQQFAQAETPKAFCQSWLPLQCRLLPGVRHAMVLLGTPDQGPYTPAAVWPDARISMSHLAGTAERSLRERRGLLVGPEDSPAAAGRDAETCQIAYPIQVREKIHGVVVLEVSAFGRDVQALMRQLHWGAAWLEVLVLRSESARSEEENQRLRNVVDLMVSGLEHETLYASATGFVTRLAVLLDCDRVSLGFLKNDHVKVEVLSHSADFSEQANLVRAIGLAMDEAVDQKATVNHCAGAVAGQVFTRAHAELARQFGSDAVLTIPLGGKTGIIGALTLERSAPKPFDDQAVAFCESAASLLSPVMEIKRREERWLVRKAADALALQLKRLLGPDYLGRKLVTAALFGLLLFSAVFRIDYRVTTTSVIEGQVKRVVAAPFNGYVKEAPTRAGDVVMKGQVICLLDDRDLSLERFKWTTEREQLTKQYHEAMAKHDRPQMQITRARIGQTEARIDLVDEQYARTRITAPFDAVVISGDLSQSLGAPVERGQVLFELAPLDAYRVIIEVDERDIADIQLNQQGEMYFASVAGGFPITVQKITPVTVAKEGRNYFRVEGRIDKGTERLRPGMEGVAKINVDRRRLIWVWTHKAVDWLRLKLWQWMP